MNCMDEQEYDWTVPVNRRDLIHAIEVVTLKADVHLTASIGRNRPRADINSCTTQLPFQGIFTLYKTSCRQQGVLLILRNQYQHLRNAEFLYKEFSFGFVLRLVHQLDPNLQETL